MWHLLHACPSWERDPSSVALPEVSAIFFFSVKRLFLFSTWQVFPQSNRGLRQCDCDLIWMKPSLTSLVTPVLFLLGQLKVSATVPLQNSVGSVILLLHKHMQALALKWLNCCKRKVESCYLVCFVPMRLCVWRVSFEKANTEVAEGKMLFPYHCINRGNAS